MACAALRAARARGFKILAGAMLWDKIGLPPSFFLRATYSCLKSYALKLWSIAHAEFGGLGFQVQSLIGLGLWV